MATNCHIASYNFSTHFVVSVAADRIQIIEEFLKEKNITFQRLPVSYAFHSPWVCEAKYPYQQFLQSLTVAVPTLPLICCAHARILEQIPTDFFWTVTQEPIRFQQTISHLESKQGYRYLDLGPAGTLATFLKYGLPSGTQSQIFTIMNPYGRDYENLMSIAQTANAPLG